MSSITPTRRRASAFAVVSVLGGVALLTSGTSSAHEGNGDADVVHLCYRAPENNEAPVFVAPADPSEECKAQEIPVHIPIAGSVEVPTVEVGTTETGAPGTLASVVDTDPSADVLLDFTIPKGEKGEKGEKGDTGDPGPSDIRYVVSNVASSWTPPNQDFGASGVRNTTGQWAQLRIASCPTGYEIVDLGWRQTSRFDLSVRVVQSHPDVSGSGSDTTARSWRFLVAGADGKNLNQISPRLGIEVTAVCVLQP